MPKAIVIKGPAGKPGKVYYDLAFKEVPFPQPSAHEVVVRISAASLNHRDLFIRQHLYPGTAFDVPLLADGCGVVVDTGAQALFWKNKRVILNPGSGWKASLQGPEDAHGYRILGGTKLNPIGTLQQYVCIDASEVEEAPSHLTDSEAAALPLTGLTAWRAVMVKAGLGVNVGPGRKILITGIGGGVALMALLFAVESGSDVWVTSSSDAKIEKAKKLGAKGGVNYRFPGWEMELLQGSSGTRKEFDAIIDGAGGDIIAKGVKLLKVSRLASLRTSAMYLETFVMQIIHILSGSSSCCCTFCLIC